MKVLVTGGSGNVGGYVIDELAGKHEATILDAKPSVKHPDVPRIEADLTKIDEALAAIKGFDAVIHLAAIPNPFNDPLDRVMSVNTTSTFNVLEAVKTNGIPRMIYACSESATGFGIHNVWYKPEYLPIDEDHPSWPHEAYSISKYLGEVMCREYSRAYGFETISLRYGWVWFEADRQNLAPHLRNMQPSKDAAFGAYVFAEDVAQAFALAVDYSFKDDSRFETFYIMADDVCLANDALEQIRLLYPDNPPPVKPGYFDADPRITMFDTRKAQRELGFKARRSYKELL